MTAHRFAAASFLGATLIIPAADQAEAARERPYIIAGAARDGRGKTVPAETLSFESSSLRLSLRYLDASGRRSALASVLGRELNLFPERSESGRGNLVFVMEVENRAGGDLIFEPGQSRLITDKLDAEFPLDYSSLFETLSGMPKGAPTLEEVERAVFSRAVTIRPGGAVRKLIVFPGPRSDRFRSFDVRIGALHLPEGDIDASFAFRKFKVAR